MGHSEHQNYYYATAKFDKLDMEKRYASAGPNKQMFDMYHLSMRGGNETNEGFSTSNIHNYSGMHSGMQPDGAAGELSAAHGSTTSQRNFLSSNQSIRNHLYKNPDDPSVEQS